MVYVWIFALTLAAQSFELALDEGIRRYWMGDYDQTINVLETTCAMSSDSGEKLECLKYLAFSHVALGADSAADQQFIELLSTDAGYRLDESLVSPKIITRFESARKGFANQMYDGAKLAYQQEQFDDAVELFERTVLLDPTHELAQEYAQLCREQIKVRVAQSTAAPNDPAPVAAAPPPRPAAELEDKVYWLTSDISAPVLVKRVSPRYPQTARLRRIEGSVVVSSVIDKAGRITQSKIVRSASEQLDRAALDALVQWQYEPATLDGFPVAVYSIVELSFTLDGS